MSILFSPVLFFSLFSCAVSYYLSGYATKFCEIKD